MDDKIAAILAITIICCFGAWHVESGATAIIASGITGIAGLAGLTMAKEKKDEKP